jgi:hypothetical protein
MKSIIIFVVALVVLLGGGTMLASSLNDSVQGPLSAHAAQIEAATNAR